MIRLSTILLFLIVSLPSWGQDKQAKKILDKMSKVYDGYENLVVDLNMEVTFPEEAMQSSKVTITQSENKYKVIHPDQEIYCNGEDIWLFITSHNEVEINDYDPEDGGDFMITPKDLLKQYQSGKYAYQLIEKKKDFAMVEFKPLDRDSDYAKFRLSIHTQRSAIKEMWAFGKDGSLVHIEITNLKVNQSLSNDIFTFDASKYPDVRIEDLRLD